MVHVATWVARRCIRWDIRALNHAWDHHEALLVIFLIVMSTFDDIIFSYFAHEAGSNMAAQQVAAGPRVAGTVSNRKMGAGVIDPAALAATW